jgi:hypothetical protein
LCSLAAFSVSGSVAFTQTRTDGSGLPEMNWFDLPMVVTGLGIGVLVGLTGMGGGALMTPILVFLFGVNAATAISSDLVVSLFMKPFGGAVHLVRRTTDLRLVGLLCLGSVPFAFLGALTTSLIPGDVVQPTLLVLVGCALLLAASGLILRAFLQMIRHRTPLGEGPSPLTRPTQRFAPAATIVLGAVAGYIVGLTSVGAGSIVIVVLLLLYPKLRASQLVGTDLVQAVPLVASAALGHALLGTVSLGIAGSVLVGAIPGVLLGSWLAAWAPGGIIRRILAIVLVASGLKLVGVATEWVLVVALVALVGGNVAWAAVKSRFSARRRAPLEPADGPTSDPAHQHG